jgi:hypothetical protein
MMQEITVEIKCRAAIKFNTFLHDAIPHEILLLLKVQKHAQLI